MRINKLTLNNFNSFEGINSFDFRVDNIQRIILIGGQNGSGKTSIFQAIKIALYGPLAFGYIGANSHYSQRVKEFINTNAFQKNEVNSGVCLNITIDENGHSDEYEINRNWTYLNKKLDEKYTVIKNKVVLDEKQLLYFENYLQSIVPPSLFDFFLFDGEEVGTIFSTGKYSNYVKEALYIMCRLDVFEILRKYSENYIQKSKNSKEEKYELEYRMSEKKLESINLEINDLEEKKADLDDELNDLLVKIDEHRIAYINSGGITIEDRNKYLKEIADLEKSRQEITYDIKSFVEEIMPFYIVKEYSNKIAEQISYEEESEIYEHVKNKITEDNIKKVFCNCGNVTNETIKIAIDSLVNMFKPNANDCIVAMHDLSKDDRNRVNSLITLLNDFNKYDLINKIQKKKKITDNIAKINRILKNTLSEEEIKINMEKENILFEKKENIEKEINMYQNMINEKRELYIAAEFDKKNKYTILVQNVQNSHVYDLSSNISKIMDSVLSLKIIDIKNELENKIVENLNEIYRKENLITHIEIDDKFSFNLFQNVKYSKQEFLSLIRNVGMDEMILLLGIKGLKEIKTIFNIDRICDLYNEIENDFSLDYINTYKKVELNRLSKGERQIFILALYWAIINVSKQDIPFVMDTPYARIDANHRKEISEKFIPNISKQVIILSTDEEINKEYYGTIKKYISKEYLLINNEKDNKTIVKNQYFFEVYK